MLPTVVSFSKHWERCMVWGEGGGHTGLFLWELKIFWNSWKGNWFLTYWELWQWQKYKNWRGSINAPTPRTLPNPMVEILPFKKLFPNSLPLVCSFCFKASCLAYKNGPWIHCSKMLSGKPSGNWEEEEKELSYLRLFGLDGLAVCPMSSEDADPVWLLLDSWTLCLPLSLWA